MGGDALSPEQAWNVVDAFSQDSRIVFSPEPTGLEAAWRDSTRRRRSGVNFWTDAYLSAFAEKGGLTLVTFDAGFARYKGIRVKLLGKA